MTPTRTTEHRKTATRAGLNYVTDGLPGITRRRAGKGWAFYRPSGARIATAKERDRIKSLVIPPAWTDVWICRDPKGHIQVTARDNSKFRRILELSEVIPTIREHAERDLRAEPLSRRQILATVVQLLDKTLIRVGSDEYAKENRSYGLTTLRAKHVQVEGDELSFSFRGKSGVQQALSITDRRIARIVQRCQDLPGQELFQYLDEAGKRQAIASEDVNDYLGDISGRQVTAKDFRTWGDTMLAGTELREMGPSPTQREAKRNINRAVDSVAERLGNTRAVCRKYYVHPALLEAYLNGLVAAASKGAKPSRSQRRKPVAALRRDEVAILQFLQDIV